MWEVEFTDEFEQWWDEFTEGAQEALDIAQEELGELLGIKQAAVSRMERRHQYVGLALISVRNDIPSTAK